ncbi:MAG: universal stress protein [Nitrososphaerota archaeon]|nr:universal stress protein [Nitrososphaerota archaeon]
MNEILIAVDGSKKSKKVVEAGCDLAKSLSAEIMLVCVGKLPETGPNGLVEFSRTERFPDAYALYLQQLSTQITDELTKCVEEKGMKCKAVNKTGNPAKVILDLASKNKVQMIVVGLTGLHGLGRMRSLGSVSRRVVENAKCPVVVVPV